MFFKVRLRNIAVLLSTFILVIFDTVISLIADATLLFVMCLFFREITHRRSQAFLCFTDLSSESKPLDTQTNAEERRLPEHHSHCVSKQDVQRTPK